MPAGWLRRHHLAEQHRLARSAAVPATRTLRRADGTWSSRVTARLSSWPRIFYPHAVERGPPPRQPASPLRGAGHQSAARPGLQGDAAVKIAIVAPLVSAIREPQGGGSQAFVADLARGLAGRGHEVHVYAATRIGDTTGSRSSIPGSIPDLWRPPCTGPRRARSRGQARDHGRTVRRAGLRRPPTPPSGRTSTTSSTITPSTRRRSASRPRLNAPVVHTLHLPPDPAVAAALRQAAEGEAPPAVACVSAFQAAAWRAVARVDAVLPPSCRRGWCPGRRRPGTARSSPAG